MIDKMTKYSFILMSGKAEDFLGRLRALGLVDITRSAKPVDDTSAASLSSSEALQKAITRLESVDFSKDPDLEKIKAAVKQDESIDNPAESCSEVSARLDVLQKEVPAARALVESSRAWGEFDKTEIDALAKKGVKFRYYILPKKKYDPAWAAERPLMEVFDNGSKVWFVTVSDKSDYSFPADECKAPEGDIRFAKKKLNSILAEIISCKAKLLELKEYVPSLKNEYERMVSDLQLYLANAGAGKAADDLITTFIGFAPSENDERLREEFDKMDILYLKEAAVKDDNPPIKFKENKFVKMFTVLTDMYGRPVYNEFDPTPYISFFFTLFFAMCMGDAGYGLLLIVVGLFLKKGQGGMSKLAPLVVTLGSATVFMGIILHTFFGIDLSTASWVPAWLKSCMIKGTVAGYDAQMLFSILIGVVHINLAMVLKATYSVKRDGFLNSLGKIGWTLLIVGGVIVGAFALLGVIDKEATKWIVIALGSISAVGIFLLNDIHRNPLLNIGSGLYETYNTVTGLLGDVLSYLRLYALGLAGGMLGSAFNSLGTTVLGIDVPGVNIVGCALILVFGHVLNLAMCTLGAFVHPLRLNFLEFFKNSGYEGTGRVYSPLAANGETEMQ